MQIDNMAVSQIMETIMLLTFGVSWPISIHKSLTSRTAKGKSGVFLSLIILGYICGLLGKFISNNISYVCFFYALNAVLVSVDLALWFRNLRIDNQSHL